MAEWDKFVINESGKVTIHDNINLDILKFPNGRKYFLDKEILMDGEILTKLKKYTQEDLKKKDFKYPIYSQVGHVAGDKSGITIRITDPKTLNEVIKEIEESVLKL
jgi:hypothetical protein